MKMILFLFVTFLFSAKSLAECRDNIKSDRAEIRNDVEAKAKRIGYHQLGVKVGSENYFGNGVADAKYVKCMPMNGMKLIMLRESDFCDSDVNKIRSYLNLYNESVNELFVDPIDCSLKSLIKA